MKSTFTSLFTLMVLTANAQEPSLLWAKTFGSNSNLAEYGTGITTDAAGNVYTVGAFFNTVDFDPGPGSASFTSNGGNDVFITKFDANGNYLWAKTFGASNFDAGHSVATDALGNVFITGFFQGTVDLDPGPGTNLLATKGSLDIFVVKYDANGNLLWAQSYGSTNTDHAEFITVDASGNVYVCGAMGGTVDFDYSAATQNVTAKGLDDIYVLKLNSAGGFVWARTVGATGNLAVDDAECVTVDALGNVYVVGRFSGTVDFDPGAGTTAVTASGYDGYLWKLNAAGEFVWVRTFGNTSSSENVISVALDATGNIVCSGFFSGTIDFDPGAGTSNLTSGGSTDVFVVKLSNAGDFMWAKQVEGAGIQSTDGMTIDATGNIYVTGNFTVTTDFDPGPATVFRTAAGDYDIYILKLNNNGDYVWATTFGGSGYDRSSGVTVDVLNNVSITGDYSGTVDFDPGPGTTNLTADPASTDVLILKLAQAPTLPVKLSALQAALQNGKVELSWKSFDDVDAGSYDILHSTNGTTFKRVGSVKPLQVHYETRYNFSHNSFERGENYYRLLITEHDGKTSYSNTVHISAKEESRVSIVSNPVSSALKLNVAASQDYKMNVNLYDVSGRKISGKSFLLKKGNNSLVVETNSLSNGNYIVETIVDEVRKTFKILKQ